MRTSINIPCRLYEAAIAAGFDGDCEAGAWLLFKKIEIANNPWTGKSETRLILREVIRFTEAETVESSPTRLTILTASYVALLKRAEDEELVVGFLHGHPTGHAQFSSWDDNNESALLQAGQNRNGPDTMLVSLLVLPDGPIKARIWHNTNSPEISDVWISGKQSNYFHGAEELPLPDEKLDRQARVFGDQFNSTVASLSVAVVGAGGTGSPLATMLVRSGVGKVAIIDDDKIEESNLHRLWGVGQNNIGEHKAEALVQNLKALKLGSKIVGFNHNVLEPACRDTLKSSNIIFCATDDHAGRMMLNRFAYFYEIPIIDIGLAIQKGDGANIQDMTGRVTSIYPGSPCLLCRNIVDPRKAREQELLNKSPVEYQRQKLEGYVLEGGDPEPAFIGMTTSVACMAMDEFSQMLSGFRGQKRIVTQRLRRFQIPEDRCSGGHPDSDCPICASNEYWGIGDVKPFLDRVN